MSEFTCIVEDEIAKLFALRVGGRIPSDFNRRFSGFLVGQLLAENKEIPPTSWYKNSGELEKDITEYFIKFIEHLMEL